VPLSARLLSDITHELRAAPAGMAAQEATVIWQRLAHKFVPLIGPSSVQLIVCRTIDANHPAHPWLGISANPGMATPPYVGLRDALAAAADDDVHAATDAMLMTYVSQLNTLIGARLTEHFLRSVFPAGVPHKDTRSKSE
jgi:hypothetical protein